MTGGFLPEITLAVLFLAGDLLLEGSLGTGAGFLAGVAAFTVSVATGKPRPALLMEGLALSVLTLAAVLTSFPGGAFALAELVIGGTLLISSLAGKPILARIGGSLTRAFLTPGEAAVLSVTSGTALLIHGSFSVALALAGEEGLLIRWVPLAPILGAGVFMARRRLEEIRREESPELLEEGDGLSLFCRGSRRGRVRVREEGPLAVVDVLDLPPGELETLERALEGRGFRFLSIASWPHPPIHLQIRGYGEAGGVMRKRIGR